MYRGPSPKRGGHLSPLMATPTPSLMRCPPKKEHVRRDNSTRPGAVSRTTVNFILSWAASRTPSPTVFVGSRLFLSWVSFWRAVRVSLRPRGKPLPRHISSVGRDGPTALEEKLDARRMWRASHAAAPASFAASVAGVPPGEAAHLAASRSRAAREEVSFTESHASRGRPHLRAAFRKARACAIRSPCSQPMVGTHGRRWSPKGLRHAGRDRHT